MDILQDGIKHKQIGTILYMLMVVAAILIRDVPNIIHKITVTDITMDIPNYGHNGNTI